MSMAAAFRVAAQKMRERARLRVETHQYIGFEQVITGLMDMAAALDEAAVELEARGWS